MLRTLPLLLLVPTFATAALIDHGDYLRDTDSGLYWLDVTKTAGLSFDSVRALTSAGGSYNGFSLAGWRVATANELDGLVSHAVGEPVVTAYVREDNSLFDLIQSLSPTFVGNTSTSTTTEYVAELRAFLDTTYVDASGRVLRNTGTFRYFSESTLSPPIALLREVNWYQIADVHQGDDARVISPSHGTFLVSEAPPTPVAVPEPPTALMVATIALLLLCSRREREHAS